jgi:hypothetical protein
MRPKERIPLHDHVDNNSGGKINGGVVVDAVGGTTLGGGSTTTLPATNITLADAGGYFTATDVEAAIAELAAKDIGYQAHGNMGSTETFSALTGWHSGTLNADCTFTFSGATSGLVASMVLELTEDGTGGWQPTWPGSVVWPGGSAPTHDDTAGSTTLYLFQSRDGGSTWFGFQAGAGTSGSTSPLTTKGDLWGYDTADARVPVGTDGYLLNADSGDAQGVAYISPEDIGHYEPLMDGGSPYAPLDDGTGTDWLFVWVP